MTRRTAVGRVALLPLLLAALIGAARGATASTSTSAASAAAQRAIYKLVEDQDAKIRALEDKLRKQQKGKKGGGGCSSSGGGGGDDDDVEADLRPFRAAEAAKAAAKKQEQLVELFNVTVGEPITAVAISSGLLEKSVPRLVVAAGLSGALHVYDRNGSLLLSQPPPLAGASAPISAIVIGQREDPFVAAGTLDGHIFVYNLTLPRPKAMASAETSLTLATHVEPVVDPDTAKPVAVLALDTYRRANKAMLSVGDAAGAVRLLFRNGTQRAAVAAGGAVRAIERGGTNSALLAAAADGVGVALFDMAKPTAPPLVCADGDADGDGAAAARMSVVSLAWDVQLAQLLYAGGADGRVAVYNTRSRVRSTTEGPHRNETKMVTTCKLVTVVEGHAPADVALAAVKGYLLSASGGGLLAVHNVSGLYGRARDDPSVFFGRRLAGAPAALAGTKAGHFAVGSGALGHLVMLGSKLVFKDKDDADGGLGGLFGGGGDGGSGGGGGGFNMMRNPLVMGGVMLLVFWQSGKFFNNNGGGGGGGPMGRRRGGGGGGFDDAEMFRAMQAAGIGRDGGDFGGLGGGLGGGMGGGMGGMGASRNRERDMYDEAFADTFARKRNGGAVGGGRGRIEEVGGM